jgi:hypothetical protein
MPADDTGATSAAAQPLAPDYGGACIASVVPALLEHLDASGSPLPSWMPGAVAGARQVVLLLLDGLGWLQLAARASTAPTLASLRGGPITSVAPTTTSAALTSIATGATPAEHGVIGYRVRVGEGRVLNVLRWKVPDEEAIDTVPPEQFQRLATFGGRPVPTVTRAYFARSGFSRAYLRDAPQVGYRLPSSIEVEVGRLLAEGEPLVVAYYDGIDAVAHERGFGAHYEAELRAADRLVGDLLGALPAGCTLLVTSDHGQVEVAGELIEIDPVVMEGVTMLSGEARFRWLHARPGAAERVAVEAAERYASVAWVRTREQVLESGWFGGRPCDEVLERLGDVALVARAPVGFRDPAEGEARLVCRHGSLTQAEMLVPLLASSS